MIEHKLHGDDLGLNQAKRTAKKLASALNRPVGIGDDLSFTVGNVTFGWEHVRDASTLLDLADLIDYFDEVNSGHYGIASTSTGEDSWRSQSSAPIDIPTTFLEIVIPRPTIREMARKALLHRS